MDIDPDYFERVDETNWELRSMVAGSVELWFDELKVIERAADRYENGGRFRCMLPDHESVGSISAACALLNRGREWFSPAGNFMRLTAVLHYEGDECLFIRAEFDKRASRLIERLWAIQEAQ